MRWQWKAWAAFRKPLSDPGLRLGEHVRLSGGIFNAFSGRDWPKRESFKCTYLRRAQLHLLQLMWGEWELSVPETSLVQSFPLMTLVCFFSPHPTPSVSVRTKNAFCSGENRCKSVVCRAGEPF